MPAVLKEWVKVAKVGDLADGDMMAVSANRQDFLLIRLGEEYIAMDLWCTHLDAQLDQGVLFPELRELECPLHESRFNLDTGEPTMPPAEDPMPIFAVRIEGGDILIGPKG